MRAPGCLATQIVPAQSSLAQVEADDVFGIGDEQDHAGVELVGIGQIVDQRDQAPVDGELFADLPQEVAPLHGVLAALQI